MRRFRASLLPQLEMTKQFRPWPARTASVCSCLLPHKTRSRCRGSGLRELVVQGSPGCRLSRSTRGEKTAKNTKKQKNAPNLYIQHFVQEVPVGQMAQGTPFGARRPPPPQFQRRGRLNLATVSNTPPKGRRIYIHMHIHLQVHTVIHIKICVHNYM